MRVIKLKFKRILAATLAAMTIAGTSAMALPVYAVSGGTSINASTKNSTQLTKYAEYTYMQKLNKAKKTTAYKNAKTKMQRAAIIADSQKNLTFSDEYAASEAYGVPYKCAWTAVFVKWCIKQSGYKLSSNSLFADPESIGVPANKTVLTYFGTQRLTYNPIFSQEYEKGIKKSNKNVATSKIKYKEGGIICFGTKMNDGSGKYYFSFCGVVTSVSTYGDTKVIGYVMGDCGSKESQTAFRTFTVNTKTGKVNGLGGCVIMSYSEY